MVCFPSSSSTSACSASGTRTERSTNWLVVVDRRAAIAPAIRAASGSDSSGTPLPCSTASFSAKGSKACTIMRFWCSAALSSSLTPRSRRS